jgi:hypothetical protein
VGSGDRVTLVKHTKGDPNWMTPPTMLARIRECLGGRIGFDPFSSHVANERVQAARYLTPLDDGFVCDWSDDAHINPPGLRIRDAWYKLRGEVAHGRVKRAMWTGFSVEQLCLLADPHGDFHPIDFSLVILRKRISFVGEDGRQGSPSHGNYLCGIGVDHSLFERLFAPLGRVSRGTRAR